MSFNLPAR